MEGKIRSPTQGQELVTLVANHPHSRGYCSRSSGVSMELVVYPSQTTGTRGIASFRSKKWSFAVSGDSRNCGDVVMPAIAEGAWANRADQMAWFEKVLSEDENDPAIKTIVLGMHEALPGSFASNHSMDESSPASVKAGRKVYLGMLAARDRFKKHVYILASHSHYYMEGVFNSPYWQSNGGVLPGWIVGTAGAERMLLPDGMTSPTTKMEKVYGYLLATVEPSDESIDFEFKLLNKSDIPKSVRRKYGEELLSFCFEQNARAVSK